MFAALGTDVGIEMNAYPARVCPRGQVGPHPAGG
jgi:hypothetical protein